MADTQLQITTTVKDLASGPLKKIGAEAQDVGRKAAQGMAQMEQAAGRAGGGFERAFGGSLKRSLGSVAIGISSAASASQGLDKNIISVGANLAGAFAVGGPWGLGLAALSTGLGALIGSAREAAESVDKLRESLAQADAQRMENLQARWKDIADLDTEIEAARTGQDPGVLKTKKSLSGDKSQAELDLKNAQRDIANLKSALAKQDPRGGLSRLWEGSVFGGGRDWNENDTRDTQKIRERLKDAERREREARASLGSIEEQTGKVDTLEAEKKAADQRKKDADEARKKEEEARKEAEQRQKVTAEINKDIRDQVELLQAANEKERLLVEQAHERRDVAAKNGDLAALAVKHAEQLKDLAEKEAEEAKKVATQQRAKAQAIADANADSEYELQLTKATSEVERLRIQQQREINRARKEGLDLLPIEKRHIEEINQLHAKERQEIADKKKAEQDFIDKLREETNVANAKNEQERAALEKYCARKKALEDAVKLGPDAVSAQMKAFKAEDKKSAADAKAQRQWDRDPLKGWNEDMGMGPHAYLRQLKKDEAKKKRWQNHADNIRAEAGWRPPREDAQDPTVIGGEPAPDAGSGGQGDPAKQIADSANKTADSAKQAVTTLTEAAEASKTMATEAANQTEAASTTATAAQDASKAAQEATKGLQDVATGMQASATSLQAVAAGVQTVVQKQSDMQKAIDAIKKFLGI